MDPELDRMLTPVKVNPEDSAAREALATYLDENSLHHDSEANRTHLRGTAPVVFHRHSESGRVMVSPKAMRANYSGPGGATIIQNAGAHVDVLHRGPIPAGARPTWVATHGDSVYAVLGAQVPRLPLRKGHLASAGHTQLARVEGSTKPVGAAVD